MTTDSSPPLRRHVDGALDPSYERAFAILDALHAQQQRRPDRVDPQRVAWLREQFTRSVARLDAGLPDREGQR